MINVKVGCSSSKKKIFSYGFTAIFYIITTVEKTPFNFRARDPNSPPTYTGKHLLTI